MGNIITQYKAPHQSTSLIRWARVFFVAQVEAKRIWERDFGGMVEHVNPKVYLKSFGRGHLNDSSWEDTRIQMLLVMLSDS